MKPKVATLRLNSGPTCKNPQGTRFHDTEDFVHGSIPILFRKQMVKHGNTECEVKHLVGKRQRVGIPPNGMQTFRVTYFQEWQTGIHSEDMLRQMCAHILHILPISAADFQADRVVPKYQR